MLIILSWDPTANLSEEGLNLTSDKSSRLSVRDVKAYQRILR